MTTKPPTVLHTASTGSPRVRARRGAFAGVIPFYAVEGLSSLASNMFMVGIFFYMQQKFGWTARQNLLLASVQGVVYVLGALGANPVSATVGRRKMLAAVNLCMLLLPLVALCWQTQTIVTAVLIAYVPLSAMAWPALESLITTGVDAATMSRRITVYNLVWSIAGVVTVAVSGTIIAHAPAGVFLMPASMHATCFAILLASLARASRPSSSSSSSAIDAPGTHAASTAHPRPEPELMAMRTLAMRLSRVALPAVFAVTYALGAMMPSLPVIRSFDRSVQTLVASVWMAARWLSFVLLGATAWWHTRPRALLVASFVMFLGFIGVLVRPSTFVAAAGAVDATSMILAQIVMGLAMGLIYSGSLYFGMVLSEGSTEHGGYHEALIGLGSILGPGFGAAAGWLRPNDPSAGGKAVATLLGLSVLAAVVLSLMRKRGEPAAMPTRGRSIPSPGTPGEG